MALDILPFHTQMLPDAGELFALRHQGLRAARPELSPCFEEPSVARAAVEAVWNREGATGVAAVSGSRLRGYLIGDLVLDPLWGRSAWIRFAGGALAPDQDVELVRDLYAALASPWVRSGCFTHFVLCSATDEALPGMWFALSFGIEHVHGLAALDALELSPRPDPPEVSIRRAGPEDRASLEALADVIWRHQVQAPVWAIHLPEREASHRREYGDLATDREVAIWLAFHQGQAVGIQGYYPVEASPENPIIPARCVHLCAAGTRDEARGRGIGKALTRHVLGQAHSAGYQVCETDWRSTNLLASRFWPRQGFRPVVYRLVRRVDSRIAWGNGSA